MSSAIDLNPEITTAAEAHHQRGIALKILRDARGASRDYKRAEALFGHLNDAEGLAGVICDLAIVDAQSRQKEAALLHGSQSLEKALEAESEGRIFTAHYAMAVAHLVAYEARRGFELLKSAVDHYQYPKHDLGDLWFVQWTKYRAISLIGLGDYDAALELLQEGRHLARRHGFGHQLGLYEMILSGDMVYKSIVQDLLLLDSPAATAEG